MTEHTEPAPGGTEGDTADASPTPDLVGLDDPRALDPELAGAKAANLARAAVGGMPVLPGFALTTHSFTPAAVVCARKPPANTPATAVVAVACKNVRRETESFVAMIEDLSTPGSKGRGTVGGRISPGIRPVPGLGSAAGACGPPLLQFAGSVRG